MTREHDDIGLSETYRELATEKAPPELNRKVLATAARGGSTRYGLARAWIRPVAWAATIMLSVAVVLEVTRQEDVTALPEDLDSGRQVEQEVQRDLGKRSDSAAPVKVSSPPAAAFGSAADVSVSEEFAADETGLLQEADERARLRAGEAREQAESCDSEDREAADSWYDCIEALRNEGWADAAQAELDMLRRAFPDFRAPDPE